MLCDRADRYATKLYNKQFLDSVGLPAPAWLEGEGGGDAGDIAREMLSKCVVSEE